MKITKLLTGLTAFQLFFFLLPVNAQKLTYQVVLGTDSIGLLWAEHKLTGNNHYYDLRCSMTVDAMIKVDLQYVLTAQFDKEKLLQSHTEQDVNGRIKVASGTKWNGKFYLIQTLEKRLRINNTISYNLTTLYFREPVSVKKVYSDTHGEFLTLRSLGQHRYELILPDGKKNRYTYQYGICTEVEVNQLFSKVYFKLVRN